MSKSNDLIEESLLPGAEENDVGFITRSERTEKVFVAVAADLNGVGDDQRRLLLGQRRDFLPPQLHLFPFE